MQFTRKHFDPANVPGARVDGNGDVTCGALDSPSGVYVYSPQVTLAINLALSTERPLIVSGEPGSGKTTLAMNVASVLSRWFYRETVTSTTRATDLLYRYDTLRRLNDAQERDRPLLERQYYVEPGTLWWALDPISAPSRGRSVTVRPGYEATNPGVSGRNDSAVVLLDEIDKADPDVPNDLLEPVDVGSFKVRETADVISRQRNLLLILTTNGERELPPAFLRRCVTLKLAKPSEDWFVKVAERRFKVSEADAPVTLHGTTLESGALLRALAREVMAWREGAVGAGIRAPGTAEYLDALRVCVDLAIGPTSPAWQSVARSVLWKSDKEPPARSQQ